MAKIIHPSDLNVGVEVTIDSTAFTIKLNETGNLSFDGVTLQALYSFLKNEWKSDPVLITKLFPMNALTSEQYEFINGWRPFDDITRKLIRNAGWAEKHPNGDICCEYVGLVTLGELDPFSQPYYQQEIDGLTTNMEYTGKVNEPIKTYGDIDNGNFDLRDYMKVFVRDQGDTFADTSNEDIEVVSLDYKVYQLPLAHDLDLNINTSDAIISTTSPWTGINITYFLTPQVRNIGGVDYDFSIIIEGNGASLEQIYEKVQYQLRQLTDIDEGAGTVIGNTADLLLEFIGDALHTSTGVYIDNYPASESKNLYVYDDLGINRPFPIVSVFTVNGLVTGSFVGIYDNEIVDLGNNNTLLDFTNDSLTSFSYTHDGTTNPIVITIIKDGYIEERIDATLGVDNQTITVVQKLDNND